MCEFSGLSNHHLFKMLPEHFIFKTVCVFLSIYLLYLELYSFFIEKPTQTSLRKTALDPSTFPTISLCSFVGINLTYLKENGYGHHQYFNGIFKGGFGWSGIHGRPALELMDVAMILSNLTVVTEAVYQIGKKDDILTLNATFQPSRPFPRMVDVWISIHPAMETLILLNSLLI